MSKKNAKTKSMKFLKKHLKNTNVCPFCGRANVTSEDIDVIDDTIERDCYCSACAHEWTDLYRIAEVLPVELFKEPPLIGDGSDD